MPSPQNEIGLDTPSNIRNCFPSHLRLGNDEIVLMLFKTKLKWCFCSAAFQPPMPAESIAPVVLQILIFKPLPFCIRNFLCTYLSTPIYNIQQGQTYVIHLSNPNHLNTWVTMLWSLLNTSLMSSWRSEYSNHSAYTRSCPLL